MPHHNLHFKSSIIKYYVFGSGDKALFCLHGYGENGSSFSLFEKYSGNIYTLYAIDFPFHGETEWNEKDALSAEDLLNVFSTVNTKRQNLFSILAYSMGGRIALYLLQKFPENIERVVLIAPDGLHENFWYLLSTQTLLGNKLFASTMKKPHLFFMFLALADKTHILNESVVKFVHHFLDDQKERMLLYKRWTTMKKFKPDLNLIKQICSGKSILLFLVFGKFDRIIKSTRASVFENTKNIEIKVIDAGHQLLKEKYASYIASFLYD